MDNLPITEILKTTILNELPHHCFWRIITGLLLPPTDIMLAGMLLQLNDFLEFNELLLYATSSKSAIRFAAIRAPPLSTRIIERAFRLGAPPAYITHLNNLLLISDP